MFIFKYVHATRNARIYLLNSQVNSPILEMSTSLLRRCPLSSLQFRQFHSSGDSVSCDVDLNVQSIK